jgi:hypothetical protein
MPKEKKAGDDREYEWSAGWNAALSQVNEVLEGLK